MKNVIYQKEVLFKSNEKGIMEFSIFNTNEINPHREQKELGVVIIAEGMQIDGSFDDDDLNSLINFLHDCRRYITSFNEAQEATK